MKCHMLALDNGTFCSFFVCCAMRSTNSLVQDKTSSTFTGNGSASWRRGMLRSVAGDSQANDRLVAALGATSTCWSSLRQTVSMFSINHGMEDHTVAWLVLTGMIFAWDMLCFGYIFPPGQMRNQDGLFILILRDSIPNELPQRVCSDARWLMCIQATATFSFNSKTPPYACTSWRSWRKTSYANQNGR